jgi:hypothetical protein
MPDGDPGHDLRHISVASTTQTIDAMTSHSLWTSATRRRAPSWGGQSRHYVRRCLEMVAAMLAGTLALAPVERLVASGLTTRADVGVLVLATNMSIGLAAWMRVRGHRWRGIAEASALIHLPFVALLVPFWGGQVGEYALLGWGHLLTLPAMALVLLLRPVENTR